MRILLYLRRVILGTARAIFGGRFEFSLQVVDDTPNRIEAARAGIKLRDLMLLCRQPIRVSRRLGISVMVKKAQILRSVRGSFTEVCAWLTSRREQVDVFYPVTANVTDFRVHVAILLARSSKRNGPFVLTPAGGNS
jgi:hypothetical protein